MGESFQTGTVPRCHPISVSPEGPLFSGSLVLPASCSLCQVLWSPRPNPSGQPAFPAWQLAAASAVRWGSWEQEGRQHRPCPRQWVQSHRVRPWWANLGARNGAHQQPLTRQARYQVQGPAVGSRQEQKERGPETGLERSYSAHPRGPCRRQADHSADTVTGATQHLRWTLAGLVLEIKLRFIS